LFLEAEMTRARWLRKPVGLTPDALKLWFYYAPGLYQAGELTEERAECFRALCETLALGRLAASEIAQFGTTIVTPAGGKKSNPAVAALLASQREAAHLLHKFGLA
jgi:phage terminase small subunit